ncbi:hypothetical protein Tco_1092241 [Tanacetum coccineum]|uniref:Zinc finger PMZ-type domain-containing protein n=1 Tax=Tanacetum coccineum TaxID=301880 RepID=A0ABQ5I9C5_9ASTR
MALEGMCFLDNWPLKEKVSQDATEIVEARRCTVDSDYESEYDSDDDSDYQSNKLVDYLSLGEEELIELRNRMKANREAMAKAKDKPRVRLLREHDIYMNELLKSLKTTDNDGITEDPFISVEKHMERLVKKGCEARAGRQSVGQRPLEYEKTVGEHYAMLRSYEKAILDSNPGSTIKLGVTVNHDDKTYFDRFYVCFAGLVDGWKAGCRKIIALDGCFLKSPNQAVKDVMTNAEHKQCERHIYENFRKQYYRFWHVIPAGWNLFEVRSGSEGFTVDEGKRTCSCRMWPLSGIPCVQATKLVSEICKEPIVEQTPKPKGVPGRPRKKQSVSDVEDVGVVLTGPMRDEVRHKMKDQDGAETQDKLKIDLTQVEQTQEQTQDQVQPQEQPQQVTLRTEVKTLQGSWKKEKQAVVKTLP